ncbi:PfkB family carbohydrate kinase [Streptomyces nogalater]
MGHRTRPAPRLGSPAARRGNGGSAAQAQHLTAELVGRYRDDRPPFSALALHTDTSSTTAIANDYGVQEVFARQTAAHGRPGDVLLLLSTSGASANLLSAADRAHRLGMTVWALTGRSPTRCNSARKRRCASTPWPPPSRNSTWSRCTCSARPSTGRWSAGRPARRGADGTPDSDGKPGTDGRPGVVGRLVGRARTVGRTRPAGPSPRGRGRHDRHPDTLVVVGDALLDHDLCGRAERLAPDAPVPVVHGTRRSPPRRRGPRRLPRGGRRTPRHPGHRPRLRPRQRHPARAAGGPGPPGRDPLEGTLASKTRVLAGDRPLLRLDDGEGRAREAVPRAVAAVAAAGESSSPTTAGAPPTSCGTRWPHGGPRRLGPPCARRPRCPASASSPLRPGGPRLRPAAGRGRRGGGGDAAGLRTAARDARTLVRAWRAQAVAVTLGDRGALLSHGETPLLVPTPAAATGDPCGAGDRFAAAAAGLLADGTLTEAAVQAAVHAATRYVAEGGARAVAVPDRPETPAQAPADGDTTADALRTAARVRAAGGTVVAAGGCFDLLHAGHVALLQAARRAGDCLIVCLNSDDSVRRRKGDGRPGAGRRPGTGAARPGVRGRRRRLRRGHPERLLGELRPHIWAKGGDYARTRLPEQPLVESWGGQVLLLPYLDGRSTTVLARRAALTPTAGDGE